MQMFRVPLVLLVLLILPVVVVVVVVVLLLLLGLLGLPGLVVPRVLLVLLAPGAAAAGRAGQRPRAGRRLSWPAGAGAPCHPGAAEGAPTSTSTNASDSTIALVPALVPVVLIPRTSTTREALASTNTRGSYN